MGRALENKNNKQKQTKRYKYVIQPVHWSRLGGREDKASALQSEDCGLRFPSMVSLLLPSARSLI